MSYNEDNLTIFDLLNNEILREEKFERPFLPLFKNVSFASEGNCDKEKIGYQFSLLFQEEGNRVVIKDCKIKRIEEGLENCLDCRDIEEAVRVFIKYEELWTETNLERIFENKGHLNNEKILEDKKLMDIIDKV